MLHWFQRALVGVLLFLVVIFQIRYTLLTYDVIAHWESVPRLPAMIDPGTLAITAIHAVELQKAGAQVGDTIVAEDGEPAHSYLDVARLFFRHRIGDRVQLTLRRKDAPPFAAEFVIPSREPQQLFDYVLPFAINVVTPWFCIFLAVLVAVRRSGDPVSYALIALLLCMAMMLKSEGAPRMAFGPLFTWPMLFLDQVFSTVLPVAWLWFALLFPDPMSRFKLLPWTRWVLGAPLVFWGLVNAAVSTAEVHRPGTFAWLPPWIQPPSWFVAMLVTTLITLGFVNFVYKLTRETELTMRRRLRWMLVGLSLGVVPVLAMLAASAAFHFDINVIPLFLLAPLILSPIFVPLTLAYATLVDRLFDVGIFFRQGLLASKSVAVVRVLLIGALILIVLSLEKRRDLPLGTRVTLSVLCLAATLLVRRGTDWVRRWVDRHFFQEAVNTEHLLMELSAEVRRIANPETLLRTVTERIASAMHVSRVAALLPNAAGLVPAFETEAGGVTLSEPTLRQLREIKSPLGISGDLYLPIGTAPDLLGVLALGPKRSEEPYTGNDIRLLESVADQTALALENSRLTATVAREAAQRERITSELEIARQVQVRLFPKAPPKVKGLDLAGHCQPAQTVGGDYYDFLITPSGRLGLAIGDVAGKGIPAALLMAGLQASLRGLNLAAVSDPADLLTKLNKLIFDATPVNRFATFFYGLYDQESRTLSYSSAGHNPILLYRAGSGEVLWLKTPGIGLGLSRNSKYSQSELTLQAGDSLVLYTDGITEARNEKEEEFGEERLVQIVKTRRDANARELLDTILSATTQFAGKAPQFDDLTLIVLRAVSL